MTTSPLEEDALARLRRDLALGVVDDATFDALYAAPIKARSSRFWTPIKVASRAARLFAQRDVRRVLDVGSGRELALAADLDAVHVIAGALQGLHAAHEATGESGRPLGVVHRDVSPQNILVGTEDRKSVV